ncbi:MAG: carbohydrate-binding domain-containing protein [Clostridia bacterium]|nr:carbohydrate-binding domain-containing protein [Clostridia bacterium]
MKRTKIIAVILAAMLTASMFTACNNSDTSSDTAITSSVSSSAEVSESSGTSAATADNADSSSVETTKTSDSSSSTAAEEKEMFTDRDLSGEYDESEATTITCKDKTFTVSGSGAKADSNVLTISEEGVYIISGTVTDGRIVVEADEKAKVQIVLKDCSITSSDYSALYVKSADKVFLTLADGTKNTISDGKTYKEDSEESNVDSAIFSKSTFTINGTGSLTVNGNMSHAIVSKDNLKIASGTITVTSVGSAVCGKDSVRIADGTINITRGGDGIKSTNTEKEDKGYVYIGSGKITITSDNDGIQAETTLTCEKAEITLTTGGGSENSSKTHTDDFGGWGKWGTQSDTSSTSSDEDSTSAKGLKAGGDITIDGATITGDCADDTVHSNSNVTINSGTLTLTSGDDGIHADSATTINGGKVTVTKSYEGIEGSNVTINGGEIDVTASDDGMNAGGGSDQSAMGGRPGQNSFTADSDVFLKITGGTVKVNADGDGLDSNNTLIIEGGTIYVDGPTDSGNGALDYETSAAISGGTLVAVGSSGMAESFSEDSKQASILYCMSESHKAGEKITLTDESGKELVSYTAAKSFNAVNISTPELTSSGKYTLKVGDSSYEIEMTSNSYSNGGGMGGGMMGGRGGMGGDMMPGGDMDESTQGFRGGRGGMGGMMQQPGESNNANGSATDGVKSI